MLQKISLTEWHRAGEQQDQISGQFLLAAYKAGDTVLAKKVI